MTISNAATTTDSPESPTKNWNGKEFRIVADGPMPGTPEEVFAAITTGVGGWLWPMEIEFELGGQGPFGGVVTAYDPPHHYANHAETDGWYNDLDNVITVRDGSTYLRYVHSGVIADDWDNQYDGATKHTEFYLHTLAQYISHFPGQIATYVTADGPAAAGRPDSFTHLAEQLGLPADAAQGDSVIATPAGLEPLEAIIDFKNDNFLGLRTKDGLYRFFGRNAFGATVGLSLHLFGDNVDQEKSQAQWSTWLTEIYA